jgi:hypothetical protein
MLTRGRPDTLSPARTLWTFTSEFFRTRHYDGVDPRDLRPAVAELWDTMGIIGDQWASRKQWRAEQKQAQK